MNNRNVFSAQAIFRPDYMCHFHWHQVNIFIDENASESVCAHCRKVETKKPLDLIGIFGVENAKEQQKPV